jgi:YesN/AraC family two-component response regulator
MIKVIAVDDHPVLRRGLKQIIAAEQGAAADYFSVTLQSDG